MLKAVDFDLTFRKHVPCLLFSFDEIHYNVVLVGVQLLATTSCDFHEGEIMHVI